MSSKMGNVLNLLNVLIIPLHKGFKIVMRNMDVNYHQTPMRNVKLGTPNVECINQKSLAYWHRIIQDYVYGRITLA